MNTFIRYVAVLVPFAALDAFWVGFLASGFYAKHLAGVLDVSFSLAPAIAFYLVSSGALLALVVAPALRMRSLRHAAVMGAVYGFASYATYDLTNAATVRGWPFAVTVADMAWGAVLCGAVSVIAYRVSSRRV